MEVAGLVIGAVALAGLFSNCLECFDLIEAGHNISRDLDIAMVKLDSIRVIFIIWGNAVGLHGLENTFNEDILGPDIQRTIYRLLSNLRILFQDAERFRIRYGGEQNGTIETPDSSTNAVSLTTDNVISLNNSQSRLGRNRNRNSWTAKFKWAIRDKKKFAVLLDDVKELVQQLRDITQAAADLQSQRRALMAEVSAISNIESLEVLEEANLEDDPEISEVASQRILQLTEGSVISSERHQSLFAESIYHTARTHARTHDLKSELETVYDPMEVTIHEEPESSAEPRLTETEQTYTGESDLAFSQQNNLKMVQELDRRAFNEGIFETFEKHSILSPHREFLNQKLRRLWFPHVPTSGMSQGRLLGELRDFYRDSTPLVTMRLEGSSLQMLRAAIQGPSGSPYEGGVFFVSILIPPQYPVDPPKCYFLTPIFHPNIANDGKVLIDVLSTRWSAAWSLEPLLMAIISMLGDPDWDGSCRTAASFIYNKDPIGFNAMSRVLTQRYAGNAESPEKLFQEYEHEILQSFVTQQHFPITSAAARDWIRTNPPQPDAAARDMMNTMLAQWAGS